MKLRVKYTQTGSSRFLSHLEMMAVLERAFRRAKIPLAFSEGFNPHPKISYGSALSVGIASYGEYLDVELSQPMDVKKFKDKTNDVLINGVEILEAKEIKSKVKSITSIIDRAKYKVITPIENSTNTLTEENLKELIISFLEQSEIKVSRKTKRGIKEINIREGIHKLDAHLKDGSLYIIFEVISGSTGNVRPQEVYETLILFANLNLKGKPAYIREDLYTLENGSLRTPMEILEG